MSPLIPFVLQLAVLAYALVGGVFLAFSDFIMRALSLTRGTGGVEAMQAINREVFRWVFMTLFLGMAVVSLLIAGLAVTSIQGPPRLLILSSALTYLAGSFGVTVVFNVPMNKTLARMSPTSEVAQEYWTGSYLPRWTFWNTIRTAACILSAALLSSGLASLNTALAQTA